MPAQLFGPTGANHSEFDRRIFLDQRSNQDLVCFNCSEEATCSPCADCIDSGYAGSIACIASDWTAHDVCTGSAGNCAGYRADTTL